LTSFNVAFGVYISINQLQFIAQNNCSCFPHVVNLACQSVLSAITELEYVKETSQDFEPEKFSLHNFLDAVKHDPIATLRSLIRAIRASALRRQHFMQILVNMDMAILQLLKDIETRWSSTYLMIDWAILLREAIEQFLYGSEFAELRKYSMNNEEWKALEVFHEILQVSLVF
ncbi:uncharacterized protein PHACADRAFT_52497, partial [Phanerochaete carnosa HHB-10118-sp]